MDSDTAKRIKDSYLGAINKELDTINQEIQILEQAQEIGKAWKEDTKELEQLIFRLKVEKNLRAVVLGYFTGHDSPQ